jgi:hypothetical protein
MLGFLLASVGGLVALICWIMVLVKMFKTQESPLMGIIGIFCSLWAFIWGWMNASKYGLKNIMLIFTLALVVCGIGYGLIGAAAAKAIQEQGMQLKPTTIETIETPAAPVE